MLTSLTSRDPIFLFIGVHTKIRFNSAKNTELPPQQRILSCHLFEKELLTRFIICSFVFCSDMSVRFSF